MMAWLKKILGWLVVGLVLGGSWWLLFGTHGKSHEDHPRETPIAVVPVTVQPVQRQPVERYVSVVGTLQGVEEIILTPKVEGRIKTVLHDINDVLAPGEPLLVLDDVDLKLAESEARRALELDLAKVALTVEKLPSRGKDEDAIVLALPTVVRAKNLEENATRKLQRVQSLGSNVTAEELDTARTEVRVAQANFQQTLIECRSSIAAAREKLAKLESAQQRLRDATLCVPVPSPERLVEIARGRGVKSLAPEEVRYVVAQRMASEGELIRASSTGVFKLVLDRPLKLVVPVPERYLAEVRVGQPVRLEVEAYPQEQFLGEVLRVNPTVDRANRTFLVEVNIPNQEGQLRSGMFAKARIQTRKDDSALVVPEESLVSFAGVNKVFVVRDNKAIAIPVRLGERLETTGEQGRRLGWLEVHGALRPGEIVVTSGMVQLADATPVRIRTEGHAEQ